MTGTLWITGAGGFTGRHLAAFVASLTDRPLVIGLDIATRVDAELDGYACVNVCDGSAVEALARRLPPRWVIHLAGATSAPTAADLWETNAGGITGLLLGLAAAGCRRVRLLGIGSAAEYAAASGVRLTERSPLGPASDYGKAKLAQTMITVQLSRTLGFDACVARVFNLLGPGLPSCFVGGRLAEQFARPQGDVWVAHTASGRDFVDVRDAADAYWRLVRCGRPGEIYNVCTGRAVMIAELVDRLAALSGASHCLRTDAHGEVDSSVVFGSCTKLRRHTGWTPLIALDRTLEDMLRSCSMESRITRGRRSSGAPLARSRAAAAWRQAWR